ncbi:cilia- and flagella-associated protein 107 [Dryobates pubescens]|uniref:cilia- and flagella-associated protein 107 n=1 Tax=Dryobates pubescens TaxID=118200 RepID=UPI0023B9CAD5|nr:cilia- and flagella-associated protein 107 [Dryobates pubescens]
MASGENWWKVQPRYSSEVLIGNWLEDRIRDAFQSHLNAVAREDGFLHISFQGLPMQCIFTHHEEPRSRHFVSEYEDEYNRRCYDPVAPPLRTWNGRKLSWVPQKADFPILEPPKNYGLYEYLLEKWFGKDDGVMKSVYTISYEKPPISALVTRHQRQPAKPSLLSNQAQLPQNISQTLDYEGAQTHLQAIGQLMRSKNASDTSV